MVVHKPTSIAAYTLYKPTGQARCRIAGKDRYRGLFGSDESRVRYGQLIAKLAGGIPVDPLADSNRGGWLAYLYVVRGTAN